MVPRPLFFIHVPKCGGTSLKALVSGAFTPVFHDYAHAPSEMPAHQREAEAFSATCRLLGWEKIALVFGHFPFGRYPYGPDHHVTVLRHPLSRAVSHYCYWRDVLPETNRIALARSPLIREVKDGTCTFLAFLRRARIAGFFASYFGDADLTRFAHVAFQEDMGTERFRLPGFLGLDPAALGRERENTAPRGIPPRQMAEAATLLAGEIAWYERLRDHWGGRDGT